MSHNSFCSSPSHDSFTEESYENATNSSGHWYFETVKKTRYILFGMFELTVINRLKVLAS